MVIYQDAVGLAESPDAVWVEGEPPRFDDPRERPKRLLCRIEELETWEGYGKPLTGLVIRDVYPDRVHTQVVVTPDPLWDTEQIHGRYRCRWSLEELYRELTTCWQLGEKGLARRADSYRALVALMLLLFAMIELFQASGAEKQSLAERQRAFKLGATHLIARCGGLAAVVTLREANALINMEKSMSRSP
jgi:IS4 transposase